MECIICLVTRSSDDFYFGNKKCYKCVLKEKLQMLPIKRRRCRICDSYITMTTRWSFCSDDCAEIGQKEHAKINYQQRLKNERKNLDPWMLI
jgi:predicted nucleic acid-binding Zn ribbon protein